MRTEVGGQQGIRDVSKLKMEESRLKSNLQLAQNPPVGFPNHDLKTGTQLLPNTTSNKGFLMGILFSTENHLISFTQEVSVPNKDLTKLIRLNSNYRVSSLFNYLAELVFPD